jgi:hypothetical protein
MSSSQLLLKLHDFSEGLVGQPPTSYGFLWTYPIYYESIPILMVIPYIYMINFPIPYGIRPRPWPWPRNDSSALLERHVERHKWRPFAHYLSI